MTETDARMLVVGPVETVTDGGSVEVRAPFRLEGRSWTVMFRTAGPEPVNERLDPFLPLALMAAVRRRVPLRLKGPVSAGLLAASRGIQETYARWYPESAIVEVRAGSAEEAPPPSEPCGPETGCFFSGGIDSGYSLLKHRAEVTRLVFVHGFDVAVGRADLLARVREPLARTARELGLPLVEVTTNLREFTDSLVSWIQCFGFGLAAVALFLRPRFRRMIIPGSNTYPRLHPSGSHPLLDPRWGVDGYRIDHDGCEVTRIDKARAVASSDELLRSLRVCWENRDGAYNCGRCEKCLRTMAELKVVGALERCPAFAEPLDYARLAAVRVPSIGAAYYLSDALAAAEAAKMEPAFVKALRMCGGRYWWESWLAQGQQVCSARIRAGGGGRWRDRARVILLRGALWLARRGLA